MRRKIMCIILWAMMLFAVFTVEVSEEASAEVIVAEEWVTRYNYLGDGYDFGRAIATDDSGNVYMIGRSDGNGTGRDYATIKYDSDGNTLWVARYNGPINGPDVPSTIAVDPTGNVYVTGSSANYSGYLSFYDYATVKYDSSGNELWVARYNGLGDKGDHANAITIGPSGNIYVTGDSYTGSENRSDYVTIAYDPNGNELWIARYNGPVSGCDYGQAITTDEFGNIYVTGYSAHIAEQTSLYMDYATVVYDSSGKELWAARYNGPGKSHDYARSVGLDSSGNVYVTGSTETVAYNSLGNEMWVGEHGGEGVVVDTSGNIYVAGSRPSGGTYGDYNYYTVAYNSSGNIQWTAIYDGPANEEDIARAIEIDISGNIYVTGDSWNSIGSGSDDYATVKYDPSGKEIWVIRYNSPWNTGDYPEDIAVDPYGNVYVTGWSKGDGLYWDFATVKYSQQEIIEEEIDIDPDTLNLKSKGKWITAYINLPEGYDVNDIDIDTILLNDVIPAEWGDVQGNTLMVKFDREEVEDLIGAPDEDVELWVTAELVDGTQFKGSDAIRVIEPGK